MSGKVPESRKETIEGGALERQGGSSALESKVIMYRAVYEAAVAVMQALDEHGGDIVEHLMDTDDNDGQRLRDAIKRVDRMPKWTDQKVDPERDERLLGEMRRYKKALEEIRDMDYRGDPSAIADGALEGRE